MGRACGLIRREFDIMRFVVDVDNDVVAQTIVRDANNNNNSNINNNINNNNNNTITNNNRIAIDINL